MYLQKADRSGYRATRRLSRGRSGDVVGGHERLRVIEVDLCFRERPSVSKLAREQTRFELNWASVVPR